MTVSICLRPACQTAAIVLTGLLTASCQSPVAAEEAAPPVTRIEEDWVVNLRSPDGTAGTPQLMTLIAPVGNLDGEYAVFELNHSSLPVFFAGGMQLQAWRGEHSFSTPVSSNAALLAIPNETIRWTVRMTLDEGQLVVEIRDGSSSTWGTFGESGKLKVVWNTNLTDLSGYRPQFSVSNSGVVRAAHQINNFGITEVRYYTASDDVTKDTAKHTVHEYQSQVTGSGTP